MVSRTDARDSLSSEASGWPVIGPSHSGSGCDGLWNAPRGYYGSDAGSSRFDRPQIDTSLAGRGSWKRQREGWCWVSTMELGLDRIDRPHRDSCTWLSICRRFCERDRSVGRSERPLEASHRPAAGASDARLPIDSVHSCSWAPPGMGTEPECHLRSGTSHRNLRRPDTGALGRCFHLVSILDHGREYPCIERL